MPVDCPICRKPWRVKQDGRLYKHRDPATGRGCDGSETFPKEGGWEGTVSPMTPNSTDANAWLMSGGTPETVPMTGKSAEIAARLRETFYAYTNRRTSDNRGAQATIGPSEIGTPCDRRLAMSLMRVPAVNPGGDGWAAFVGTCVHAGLASMLEWSNAGSGRYATEVPLSFPSVHVPHGTGDALDRVLCLFLDHKVLGRWSLARLRDKGPSQTYRVQVHTYGHGARLKGEKVDHVAIVGWPREGSSLDDLFVWSEPYDPTVARDALARVDRIAERLGVIGDGGPLPTKMLLAQAFETSDDCRYCPFHAPGDETFERGCSGRT